MAPDPGQNASGQNVALVAIGRNEGDRLKRCLRSVMGSAGTVVYVDSGSTDGSVAYAASAGCHVVELDPSRPFSAAYARNEGVACILKQAPGVPFIQFVDGDCEMAEGWLAQAVAALEQRPDVGAVSGHVRELYPEATVYNKLCDLEWRKEPGEIDATGGIFMVRTEAFMAVGGFRPEVIAAEDNEFCIRVRATGKKILHLDAEMVRHDAAMTHFSQWWRRAKRTGHAYGQVAALHGKGGEQYFVSDRRRVWVWGLALPLAAILLARVTHGASLLALLAAYALQFVRIYQYGRGRGWPARDARVYAFFTVLFKFPALLGLLAYHWRQWRGDDFTIIEHKGS
ncbi:MAG TPA: glycosyltransferase [Acidobacteriaceae bacterium]|nr:glycosyltransferase [Acidobacteriaceae bacterium]